MQTSFTRQNDNSDRGGSLARQSDRSDRGSTLLWFAWFAVLMNNAAGIWHALALVGGSVPMCFRVGLDDASVVLSTVVVVTLGRACYCVSCLQAAGGSVGALWALAADVKRIDCPEEALNDLEERRKDLQKQRKSIARSIKNEEKKRTRVVERARRLSDNDLLNLMASRAAAKAKVQAKAAKKSVRAP